MSYIKNVAIALDQLFNTIIGGMPDETISAKTYRMWVKTDKWYWYYTMIIINKLFNDHTHCYDSYLSEVHRRQLSQDYQTTLLDK